MLKVVENFEYDNTLFIQNSEVFSCNGLDAYYVS